MKTRNIITLLWVATVLGGCAQGSSVGSLPANRVTQSNGANVSKNTTFINGAMFPNGASLPNGASRALALTNLATRPLAKKD
jgi:hypothetical protein